MRGAGREPSGSLLCRRQVVGDASVADEQGVDAEAQVAPRRRFVGREGVDKELVVGDGGRVAPGKVEVHVVQLHVVDDDVSLQQGAQVELGRDAARFRRTLPSRSSMLTLSMMARLTSPTSTLPTKTSVCRSLLNSFDTHTDRCCWT